MTPLGVMVLGNHEVGQVAHCGQADRYGSVTQTIAIFCRPLIRTTCSPPCTYATIWPRSYLHTHPPPPSPHAVPPRVSRTAFRHSVSCTSSSLPSRSQLPRPVVPWRPPRPSHGARPGRHITAVPAVGRVASWLHGAPGFPGCSRDPCSLAAALVRLSDTAWMPRSCRCYSMNEASTPYDLVRVMPE
jgi:hypothetical protein